LPNFGFEVYLHSEKYYIGLYTLKVIRNTKVSFQGDRELEPIQDRHFFLTVGYAFDLNSVVENLQSFMVKSFEDLPLSADVNVNFFFMRNYG
tara:strand:- start:92 stop:367 length:276 start_codon:yes stop_codon:yes gene_type:complete